jgi:alpha-mannosidase
LSIHCLISGMVYKDAEKLYAEVRKDGEALIEEAFEAILRASAPLAPHAKLPSGHLIALNTTFFPRRDVVKIPLGSGWDASKLKSKVVQTSKNGKDGYALMECSEGESVSFCSGLFADCNPVSGELFLVFRRHSLIFSLKVYTNGSDHFVLRNASVQLTISCGRITSLFDVRLGSVVILVV